MSRKSFKIQRRDSKPSFTLIIILILILLQFGKGTINGPIGDGDLSRPGVIDNGILFIITLFFLTCFNKCERPC